MPFRASNQIPMQAYTSIKAEANKLSSTASLRAAEFTSAAGFDRIWQTRHQLRSAIERLDVLAAAPGLIAYAKDQESDQAYDVVAEFNALKALMEDAADWIDAALPKDGNDYLLVYKVGAQGLIPRSFSAAALAPLVTKLQAIVTGVS